MRIDIISCLPELLDGPLNHSILKRAADKKFFEYEIHNLRDYASGRHRQVDDVPYGGGAGMVLKIEPIHNCISHLKEKREYDEVILLSPDGISLNQQLANRFAVLKNIILLCGHYKGVDERVRAHLVTTEISIGDYVLSGGELPALVLTDAIVRLIPGVLSDETSALSDSFQDGLVAPPCYTRPAEFMGWKVPEVLLSGNHSEIEKWREEQSTKNTTEKRPEFFKD